MDTGTAPAAETPKAKKDRKRNYRDRNIVLGCLDERLSCFLVNDGNTHHIERMRELLDELRRSLGGKEESE